VVLDAPQHEDNTGEYGKHQGICKMLKKVTFFKRKVFLKHFIVFLKHLVCSDSCTN